MKTIISLLTVTVLTLTFGLAFADEMPVYFPEHKTEVGDAGAKGSAAGGVRTEEKSKEAIEKEKIFDNLFNVDRQKDLP